MNLLMEIGNGPLAITATITGIGLLFLIFDVETVFLYPWAVIARSLGVQSLLCIGIFLFILVLGLAYAWRKGALKWT